MNLHRSCPIVLLMVLAVQVHAWAQPPSTQSPVTPASATKPVEVPNKNDAPRMDRRDLSQLGMAADPGAVQKQELSKNILRELRQLPFLIEIPIQAFRAEYTKLRDEFIEAERKIRWGNLTMTSKEQKVEDYLVKVRKRYVAQFQGIHELDGQPINTRRQFDFPPSKPFPLVKNEIEETDSFAILRKMPKGAVLHVHSSACGSAQWVVDHMGDYDDCYVYWPSDTSNRLRGRIAFFNKGSVPNDYLPAEAMSPVDKEELIRILMIEPSDYEGNVLQHAWYRFGAAFDLVGPFITNVEVYGDYFEAALQAFVDDGVIHVEIRTNPTQLSSLEGPQPAPDQFVKELLAVRDRLRKRVPPFNIKLIISTGRVSGTSESGRTHLNEVLNKALKLHHDYGDVVIGFDLVGKEGMTNQTRDVLGVWMGLRKQAFDSRKESAIPFYFHDGETDWADNPDVVDAVLLGSRRIGHAFNLVAYPKVEDELKRKGIAIEICPISNQILRYVQDLRIHPACGYIRRGVPCVLSCDDPLILGNAGLSYDFWVAWMAWDLRLQDMKMLALNSIVYSGMTQEEQGIAVDYFMNQWQEFIDRLIKERNL